MNYTIRLFYLSQQFTEIQLDHNTTIQELIDFLIEGFPETFKEQDKPKILILQRSSKKYLNPKDNLQKILGQKQGDVFDIEINQQSLINQGQQNQSIQGGYPVIQQNQIQNSQQNSNQYGYPIQSQNQYQSYKITFKYNDNIISCELEGDTTLENIFEYMIETLNIRENVNFIWNQTNLSQLNKQTKLENLKLNQSSEIIIIPGQNILNTQQPLLQQDSFQSQSPKQQTPKPIGQGNMIKIQFEIEDGMIKRSCVLNCYSNQQFQDLKMGVLNFIGINTLDIADVDFYFGQMVFGGTKLSRTLEQLQINQDYTTIKAKIRWIGG